MAAGSLQTIVVCQPKAAQSGPSTSPCADVNGVFTEPVLMNAYVVDPGMSTWFEAESAPFDYAAAGGMWFLSFSTVVILYIVSQSAGHILRIIRG